MKELIRWNEANVFFFTNHCVDKIKQTEWFNKNHIAKVLIWHIETYKTIIDNLLENENKDK